MDRASPLVHRLLIVTFLVALVLPSGIVQADGPHVQPPPNTKAIGASKIGQVPLQPVGVGPMWTLGLSVPALGQDWPGQAQLTQNAADGGRINVPSPTVDFQVPISLTDATPNLNGACQDDSNSQCVAGDFGSYSVTVDECLTQTEAQAIGYSYPEPDDCQDSDYLPGQWYPIGSTAKTLLGSAANANSAYVGSSSRRAAAGRTARDVLAPEVKLPKIANILRFEVFIGVGDSNLPCGPNAFSCGQCPNAMTGGNRCDNGLIYQAQQLASGPLTVVVIPAALAQLQLLPYTILYAPPGDDSAATFSTTTTFTTSTSLTSSTALDTSTSDDTWLQYGETDDLNLGVTMGGDGVGLTDNVGYDFSPSRKWDHTTTSGTGLTSSNSLENGLQVKTSYGEELDSTSKNQVPGAGGSYDSEPFWSDVIVALRHPQLGIWDFNGTAQVKLLGADGSPLNGPDWVSLSIRSLDDCAKGQPLSIPPDGEMLSSDQCAALASLDPFYGIGQAAPVGPTNAPDSAGARGMFVMSGEYGMGVGAKQSDDPVKLTDSDIITKWQGATKDQETSYTASVQDVLATQSSSGLSLGGDLDIGPIKFGGSQKITVALGEIATDGMTLKIGYKNSSAAKLQQDWSLGASISDDHLNLKGANGQAYMPFVEVFQDKAFGSFMFRDPSAPCSVPLCVSASLGPKPMFAAPTPTVGPNRRPAVRPGVVAKP
jgi:hypothetical protein